MATVDREQKAFIGNKEHLTVLLDVLKQDNIRIWNDWRVDNPRELPDLKGINLVGALLANVDFSGANLDYDNLSEADLVSSNLSGTNFFCANMSRVKMLHATAHCCQLREVDLIDANLSGSAFNGAGLKGAILTGCKIHGIARIDWEIEEVKCDYVYIEPLGGGRFPRGRDFYWLDILLRTKCLSGNS